MVAKTFGSAVSGVDANLITIEVNVGQGTNFFMVGLPDSAVKESQQRVESALKYFGYRMPRQRVVVNLAPADLRKEGSAYDLPIAMGILQASEQVNFPNLDQYVLMGGTLTRRQTSSHQRGASHRHRSPEAGLQGIYPSPRKCQGGLHCE